MPKFNVFGRLLDKGDTAQIYFDKNGRVVPTEAGSVATVEFYIDEDHDPVGHVLEGAQYFEYELLYFGAGKDLEVARASLSAFDGRLVLCVRHERIDSVDHFFVWKAEMKLWLLTVNSGVGEGALASLVVRAEDEQSARQLAAQKSSEDRGHDYRDDPTTECYLGKGCWLDGERTSISEIPLGGECVIHAHRSY